MTRAIKLIVVSTNVLTRNGIQQSVNKSESPAIEVVGTYADFKEAGAFLSSHVADVLFIDEALPPNTNLLGEVKALNRDHLSLAIVVILQRPTVTLIQMLLDHGVRGILRRNDDLEQVLVQAIVSARQRGVYLSPGVSRLLDTQRRKNGELKQIDLDVMRLLAEGFEPKEIAVHLGSNGSKIYRIIKALKAHYHAHSNANLIDIAHREKLFDDRE